MCSDMVVALRSAEAPGDVRQKLAWAGALVITLSILVLSVVARLVLKKDTAR